MVPVGHEPRWEWVARNDRADFYWDAAFGQEQNDSNSDTYYAITITVPRPEEEGGPRAASALSFHWVFAVDCARQLIGIADYATTTQDGRIFERHTPEAVSMQPVDAPPRGAITQALADRVCEA